MFYFNYNFNIQHTSRGYNEDFFKINYLNSAFCNNRCCTILSDETILNYPRNFESFKVEVILTAELKLLRKIAYF